MSKIMLMRIFDFFDFLSIRRDSIQKVLVPVNLKDILVKFQEVLDAHKTA